MRVELTEPFGPRLSKPLQYHYANLPEIGAPTENRTQFHCLQGSCIAINALEAENVGCPFNPSNYLALTAWRLLRAAGYLLYLTS